MALERTILDFLAATLVAIDGARSGPVHTLLTADDLGESVIRPALSGPDAEAFRGAIEAVALRARTRMEQEGLDVTSLTLLMQALTGHLLAADGHVDPFAAVEDAVIRLGFDARLTHDLLEVSFSELAPVMFSRRPPALEAAEGAAALPAVDGVEATTSTPLAAPDAVHDAPVSMPDEAETDAPSARIAVGNAVEPELAETVPEAFDVEVADAFGSGRTLSIDDDLADLPFDPVPVAPAVPGPGLAALAGRSPAAQAQALDRHDGIADRMATHDAPVQAPATVAAAAPAPFAAPPVSHPVPLEAEADIPFAPLPEPVLPGMASPGQAFSGWTAAAEPGESPPLSPAPTLPPPVVAAVAPLGTLLAEVPATRARPPVLADAPPAANFGRRWPPIPPAAPPEPLPPPRPAVAVDVPQVAPPLPSVPPVPPMIAHIAATHGIDPQALLPVLHHPALATVPLERLEQSLNQSAEALLALAQRLAGKPGESANAAVDAMQRQAALAILAGDTLAANQLLSGLEAQASSSAGVAPSAGTRERDTRRAAEYSALRAGLAEAQLDYRAAAQCYGAASAGLEPRDKEMRWLYALRQGTALQTGFEYGDDLTLLEEAVVVYARALSDAAPTGVPHQPGQAALWVLTQNSLGNALSVLGERNRDAERLRLAAWSYAQAILAKDAKPAAGEWALLHVNQATALIRMAEYGGHAVNGGMNGASIRDKASDALKQAIALLDKALQVYDPRAHAADHFTATVARATALTRLGLLERDRDRLEAAVEALMLAAASTPATAETSDRIRVAAQLGDVYCELSDMLHDPGLLDRAIEAYEAALELVTSADGTVPGQPTVTWAEAATSLANAQWTAGRLTNDVERLSRAENLFASAARIFAASGAVEPAAAINRELGQVRSLISQLRTAPAAVRSYAPAPGRSGRAAEPVY